MKKYLLIFCTILCHVVTQAADVATFKQVGQKITVDFELPTYDIDDVQYNGSWEVFSKIRVERFNILGHIGKPDLPIYTMDFALSEGIENIEARLVNAEYEEIQLSKRLSPFEPITENGYVFVLDTAAYSSSESELSNNYLIGKQYVMFAQRGFTFSICPFNYNPISNKLKVLKRGEFVIKYNGKNIVEKSVSTNEARETLLEKSFVNYNEINNAKRAKTYSNCNYLIITPLKYWNSLYGFVKRKSQMGYNVYTATTETIGSDKDAIKNFIQSRYNNESTRPTFVMIVGDVDDVPFYSGVPSYEWDPPRETPISDLGYSLLDGDDLLADVFLGRLSVSSIDELSTYLSKLEYMETNIEKFKPRVLAVAGAGANCYTFASGIRSSVSYFENRGWKCDMLNVCNGDDDSEAFHNKMKNDNYLLYLLSGHGAIDHIGSSLAFYKENFVCKNTYPVFIAMSCLTGNYGSLLFPSCFAEDWIRSPKGGVGYYGGSVSTLISVNDVIVGCIMWKGFAKYDQPAVMCIVGKNTISNTLYDYQSHMEAYNYFGDPSYGFGALCKEKLVVDNAFINEIKDDNLKYIGANSTVIVNGTLNSDSGRIVINAEKEIEINGETNIENCYLEIEPKGCRE